MVSVQPGIVWPPNSGWPLAANDADDISVTTRMFHALEVEPDISPSYVLHLYSTLFIQTDESPSPSAPLHGRFCPLTDSALHDVNDLPSGWRPTSDLYD